MAWAFTNDVLARGAPRFEGIISRAFRCALGFYDLTDPQTLRAQAALAKEAGVGGFVFYYYDFDGRRLLEKPLEMFLASPDIDIGFCLTWANENWTRRWDGAEDEVLIAQSYDAAHEGAARGRPRPPFPQIPRYVRLDGRPLADDLSRDLIPDTAATLERWRRLFAERFGQSPIFVMAQTFEDVDPRPLGFDGAVEFPPHKLTRAGRRSTTGWRFSTTPSRPTSSPTTTSSRLRSPSPRRISRSSRPPFPRGTTTRAGRERA